MHAEPPKPQLTEAELAAARREKERKEEEATRKAAVRSELLSPFALLEC